MSNLQRRPIWPPTIHNGKGRAETAENLPRHCPCCLQARLNTTEADREECIPWYLIGGGGFCDVFVASYRGARVAMKIPRQRQGGLPATEGQDYEEDVYRLMLEGSILQRLNHPNIIRVYKYQCNPPQLVMELHEKGSLRTVMRRCSETLDKRTLLTWARQIASAMKYWHGLGLLLCHGDLTTANILISAAGDAIVCDAGMAKYKANAVEFMTDIPDPADRNYLCQPPEAILNGTFGEKSDVYSFGIILLEMVTGEEPFEITYPGHIYSLHHQIARERMQPTIIENLSETSGWSPAQQDCINLAKRCWSAYLNDRPTFTEIEEKLTHILEGLDRPVAKKSSNRNTLAFVVEVTIVCVVLAPILCTFLWTHEPPLNINSVSGNGKSQESGELLEFSCFVTVMTLATMMILFVSLFLSVVENKHHGCSFSEKIREERFRIGAWLSAFLRLPWRRRADPDAVPDTPFRRGLPHVLRRDSLDWSHQALADIPLPDSQEWMALRQGLLRDVTHQSEEEMPWREEIHSFCERHEGSCPDSAQWQTFLEMLAVSPVARAMPAWAEFEARFIEPSVQHTQNLRDPGECASESISLPVSFIPAMSGGEQVWRNDFFRQVEAGNEIESTSGLSSASTLSWDPHN